MGTNHSHTRRRVLLALAAVLIAAGCSDSDTSDAPDDGDQVSSSTNPTSSSTTEPRTATDWGPVIAADLGGGGNLARNVGFLTIVDGCLMVERDGEAELLVWHEPWANWDPATETLTYAGLDSVPVTVKVGDAVELGGGGESVAEGGRSAEELLSDLQWATDPPLACLEHPRWFVADVTNMDPNDLTDTDEAMAARGVVQRLHEQLAAGDTDAARELTSGLVEPGDLDRFLADYPWFADAAEIHDRALPPPWLGGETHVVVASTVGAGELRAAAFLIGRDTPDAPTPSILRFPTVSIPATPEPGSTVVAGETITLDAIPVEGGASAYFGDIEAEVAVDYQSTQTVVVVPDGLEGPATLTVAWATPEVPHTEAYIYEIAPPRE